MLLIGRAEWKNLFQPVRSTARIWVVTRHQYGISSLVSQTAFYGESVGGVAKCRLFSQASTVLARLFGPHTVLYDWCSYN